MRQLTSRRAVNCAMAVAMTLSSASIAIALFTATVADFMMWPRKNVGWYVEPGYEVTFRQHTTHRGFAIAVGLLLGR